MDKDANLRESREGGLSTGECGEAQSCVPGPALGEESRRCPIVAPGISFSLGTWTLLWSSPFQTYSRSSLGRVFHYSNKSA